MEDLAAIVGYAFSFPASVQSKNRERGREQLNAGMKVYLSLREAFVLQLFSDWDLLYLLLTRKTRSCLPRGQYYRNLQPRISYLYPFPLPAFFKQHLLLSRGVRLDPGCKPYEWAIYNKEIFV